MESSNADGIESKQTNARTDEYTHQEQKLTVLTPEAAPASFNVPQLPSRSATKYDSAMREQSTITTTTNERNDIVVSIPNEATKFETANTNILGESTTPAVVQNNTCSVTCTVSIRTVGSICCRICHNTDGNDRLISPCLCKGTLAYVHRSCLEHWLSTSRIVYCELCQYRFSMETMLRYTFCQSIRIWYRHPNNRGLLQADCLVCTLLTVVTFGLVAICMLGLQYFNLQSYRFGVSRLWTQGSIIIFLVIVNAELHKIAAGMQGEMTCWDSREVGEYGIQHFKEMKTAYGRRIAVFLENKFLFLPPRFSENYLEAACQPQQDREPLTRL